MQTIGGEQAEALDQRKDLLAQAQAEGASWDCPRWIAYLESINPALMELGLNRVKQVADRLDLNQRIRENKTLVVTVAGTNGKGSTCALIAQTCVNLGVPTACYTSPHLIRFNERIRINGQDIADEELASCLNAVIQAQGTGDDTIYLSYFEITTLAAVLAFVRQKVKIMVLEVGLGGRLDAVNIFNTTLAIITSIGLDHVKILGNTEAAIAHEKAGIIQGENTIALIGANMSEEAEEVILDRCEQTGAVLYAEHEDFSATMISKDEFSYTDEELKCEHVFPKPRIPFSCVALALNAIFKILLFLHKPQEGYEELKAIADALESTALPGRMQKVGSDPALYLDVAHNVPAAKHLRDNLLTMLEPAKRHIAVIGMLKDKDVEGVINVVKDSFDAFYFASLHTLRGEESQRLCAALQQVRSDAEVHCFETVAEALAQAQADAHAEDLIIVMGSFVTVAEAQECLHLA